MLGGAVVPLPHHRRGPQQRDAVPREQPLRRRRAGAARAVPRLHDGVRQRRAAERSTREQVRNAFSHLVLSDRVLDQLGPGRQRRPLAVRLRPARKRQDGHLAGDRNLLDGDIAHPARARSRRAASSGSSTRSTTSRCPTAPTTRRFEPGHRRSTDALGPLPPAAGHGRRRADARRARPQLQPRRPDSTARRCSRWPTAACSSSTTSAASSARRAIC